MDAVHLALLYPQRLTLRDLLRVGASCSALHAHAREVAYEWLCVAYAAAKMTRKEGPIDPGVYILPSRLSAASLTYRSVASRSPTATVLDARGNMFTASRPTEAATWNYVRRRLCRECHRPTASVARAVSGEIVKVCVACSKDPTGYSRLVDRKVVSSLAKRHPRGAKLSLSQLVVARRGGNRAHLYWAHQVLQLLDAPPATSGSIRALYSGSRRWDRP